MRHDTLRKSARSHSRGEERTARVVSDLRTLRCGCVVSKACEPNRRGGTSRITGRARAHKRYRPARLCSLRLIRLFGGGPERKLRMYAPWDVPRIAQRLDRQKKRGKVV